MSKSNISDPDTLEKTVYVIYSDDGLIPGDPEYKERKKMKLGEALAEIDNSTQFSFCTCKCDIRDHEPSDDFTKRLAGKCKNCSNCQEYNFSGEVKTRRELLNSR